ncbi:MAG: CYTH domain-containing protein [Proteobacteria bacterium]|nr:CYTH domain-containing protein [Pseudomonadota bacterium]
MTAATETPKTPMEIERKFLVAHDGWRNHVISKSEISQFYLTGKDQFPTVRLRTVEKQGFLTIKYKSISDSILARAEFEYAVPYEDVEQQMPLASGAVIRKTRFQVEGPDKKIWEVDIFVEPIRDLVLAEIELDSIDETFDPPDWLGKEVTQNHNYSNLALSFPASDPFK